MGKIIICKICERALVSITLKLSFLKSWDWTRRQKMYRNSGWIRASVQGILGGDKPLPLIPHHSSVPFFSFSFSFLSFFLRPPLFFPLLFSIPHANNIRSPFGIINPLTHQSEYRLISPLSINPELNIEITRKKKNKMHDPQLQKLSMI